MAKQSRYEKLRGLAQELLQALAGEPMTPRLEVARTNLQNFFAEETEVETPAENPDAGT